MNGQLKNDLLLKFKLIFIIFCRWLLAGVFIIAALYKIFDIPKFAAIIFSYHLLADYFINITALILPYIEIISALCLLFIARLRAAASFIIFCLLIIFSIILTIKLFSGDNISCGCFFNNSAPISWLDIIRDVILAILAFWLFLKELSIENRRILLAKD